jgi:hypothetical protein
MPIGSSKIGVLGAGLVPGGSVTFNASGTWPIPPGVKKVSITGVGGTGNPGVAGNSGNAGNPGGGAPGGNSGGFTANSGLTFRAGLAYSIGSTVWGPQSPNSVARGPNNCPVGFNCDIFDKPVGLAAYQSPPAQSGQGGTAGSAGSAGNPGNTGQASSALCNTFPGGCGGNAGVAGNAGTAGTGGLAGAKGQNACQGGAGGVGGTGGGTGGAGFANPSTLPQRGNLVCGKSSIPQINNCCVTLRFYGGAGGGGAGATNSGGTGGNAFVVGCGGVTTNPTVPFGLARRGVGGTDNNISASAGARPACPGYNPFPQTANTMGGPGGGFTIQMQCGIRGGSDAISLVTLTTSPPFAPASGQLAFLPGRAQIPNGYNLVNFSPSLPTNNNVYRAGGGGAAAGIASVGVPRLNMFNVTYNQVNGAGGGGGGRGNAGNAGGTSPTPTGTAGTPATFNCVPVTPGGTAPITVGTPGGQIVISWNPQ